jgi:hypothetical protein
MKKYIILVTFVIVGGLVCAVLLFKIIKNEGKSSVVAMPVSHEEQLAEVIPEDGSMMRATLSKALQSPEGVIQNLNRDDAEIITSAVERPIYCEEVTSQCISNSGNLESINSEQIEGTYRTFLSHSSLRDPSIADPDSKENQYIRSFFLKTDDRSAPSGR